MSTTGPEPGSGPTDTDTASRRRSSFAEMFSRQPAIDIAAANGGRTNAMAIAMQQQQQHEQRSRRLSVSALGLSGSPTRISPSASAFETLRDKSMGARPRAASTAVDENAVDDAEPVAPLSSDAGSRPTSPSVGRRLSFGAMAYRDQMRSASGGSDMSLSPEGSGGTGGGGASPPPSARREGFNWSENLRNRAQRSSTSFSQGAPFLPLTTGTGGRAKSVAEPSPGPAAQPPKAAPPKAPDHFQERILKGDFYMD